jgi:hypothetical protein
MRIRPYSARSTQSSAGRGSVRLLLVAALATALLMAGGIWYMAQGYQLVNPLFADLFAPGTVEPNTLPTLDLNIRARDYQEMAKQRLRAVETGMLQPDGEAWHEARIRFQETEIPVLIRLRGSESERNHPADHWQTDKWSLKVETQNGTSLLGMRSFSLQSPATHAYLNAWLYMEELRRAGILAPRYTFVHVCVNGRDWGVYGLKEAFSHELLASQQRREGVILRPKENALWGRQDTDGMLSSDARAIPYNLPVSAQIDVLYAGGDQDDAALSGQAADALGLLQAYQNRQLAAAQVFDARLVGRYIAHANLWGACHELTWHSAPYYYNPLTTRLEPIGYDPVALGHGSPIHIGQCDDLAVVESYAQEAMRISQPEYLQELLSTYVSEFSRYRAALLLEFLPEYLEAPWDVLTERQALLHASLHPPQTVHAYQDSAYWMGKQHHSTVDVQIGNLLPYPVVLREIRIGQLSFDLQPSWIVDLDGTVPDRDALLHADALPEVVLRPMQGDVPRYITLRIPTTIVGELAPQGTPLQSDTLRLVTSLVGVGEQVIVDVQADYLPALSQPVLPEQPSIAEALERYPFLALADQPGLLTLRPGTWHVSGDLVLPDGVGLWASQAVTLTFDRQAALFATGPLLLHCPDGERIYLGPQDEYWAGLVVLDAGSEAVSSFTNVEIRGSRGVRRGGWATHGGITFYESPIVMNKCRVLDAFAPAAINVVRADFQFVDSEFGNASGDALDGDFVQGQVERCAIHDILGNGIDVSGSKVTIRDTSLLGVYDTAILADQGSVVVAQGIRANDVGIAIASRDVSSVHVQDARIEQARVAGLVAYREKATYGEASIQASDVAFEDQSVQVLVQNGNSATIDGVAAPTGELDASTLRRPTEVSPPMHPLAHRLGSAIWLRGYEISTPQVAPGERIQFILYWRAFAKPDRQYTVFVHVLDPSGETVAGWDSMPRHNTLPTTDWPIGTLIEDPRFVPLPQDLPAGEYRIALGMYYWATGERLPVQTTEGQAVPDARIILDQTIAVK